MHTYQNVCFLTVRLMKVLSANIHWSSCPDEHVYGMLFMFIRTLCNSARVGREYGSIWHKAVLFIQLWHY